MDRLPPRGSCRRRRLRESFHRKNSLRHGFAVTPPSEREALFCPYATCFQRFVDFMTNALEVLVNIQICKAQYVQSL